MASGTLLIVDDEADLRTILAEILKGSAREVHVAADGKEALGRIRTGSIDVVLSDINMPAMSGLELLAQVRAQGIEMPFVFLTGYGDKEKAIEALRLGATDFLEKPFDPARVINVIGKAMQLSHAMKEVEVETESLYATANLPADRLIRLRKMRQAIVMMRRALKIYSE